MANSTKNFRFEMTQQTPTNFILTRRESFDLSINLRGTPIRATRILMVEEYW